MRSGRPTDLIREMAREAFADRIPALADIADGALALWRERCPNCGYEPGPPPDLVRGLISPGDRIRAIDTLGKYGPGTIQEMSTDSVRVRLARTIELIRSELEPGQAATLLAKMAVLWE